MFRSNHPDRDAFIVQRSRGRHGLFGQRIVSGQKLHGNPVDENVLRAGRESLCQRTLARGPHQDQDVHVVGACGLCVEQHCGGATDGVVGDDAIGLQRIEFREHVTKGRHASLTITSDGAGDRSTACVVLPP